MEALETVRNLEAQLVEKRKEVAKNLRASREALRLSLREVGYRVKLTPGALLNIEQGKSWRTKTVAKLARFYERAA
jgi:transcriptional regulator with XRE-family HTH domain